MYKNVFFFEIAYSQKPAYSSVLCLFFSARQAHTSFLFHAVPIGMEGRAHTHTHTNICMYIHICCSCYSVGPACRCRTKHGRQKRRSCTTETPARTLSVRTVSTTHSIPFQSNPFHSIPSTRVSEERNDRVNTIDPFIFLYMYVYIM